MQLLWYFSTWISPVVQLVHDKKKLQGKVRTLVWTLSMRKRQIYTAIDSTIEIESAVYINSKPMDALNNSVLAWNSSDLPRRVSELILVSQRVEYRVGVSIIRHVLPVVIGLGTVGNVLSFLVLMRKRMRNTSVYFYLAMLACADTVVLYSSGFKTWIRLVSGFHALCSLVM